MAGTFDASEKTVSPGRIQSNNGELARELNRDIVASILHHRVIARLMLPPLGKVPLRAAGAQTAVDEATLACALERHRLANGQFPENLEALTPKFIARMPNDILTGRPYKYRRTNDGQFVLYSVGWDEEDDGGVPGAMFGDDKTGDWVWEYVGK